jgi:SPOR domain
MADDSIVRSYRSSDPARRASAPAAPRDSSRDITSRDLTGRDIGGGDPLAELARLIGQADPFTDLDRAGGRASDVRPRAESAPSDWRKTAAALARESIMRDPPSADPHFDEVESAITVAKSLRAAPGDRFAPPAEQYLSYDQSSQNYASQNYASQDYAPQSYAPHDAAFDQVEPRGGDRFDEYGGQISRQAGPQRDDGLHDRHLPMAQQGGHESENYFFDGAAAPADERFYDDPPRARAANGLITAVVLVGCGILGTAGAYGYRTYYSGPRSTDAPIISADKSAIKVMPAPADGDAPSGKLVQERVGSANERMVPRQEEPVAADPSGPRVVLPAPFTPSPGPGPAVGASNPMSASVAGEPKKVHTVPIRPEGGSDPMGRPVGAVGAPLQTAPSAQVATARPPASARPAAPPPAPAHPSGGPLSLQPGQSGDAATADAAPANGPRLASVAPSGGAAASSSSAGGGYVVQISSQRSEADAQASFRSLQSKFPSQLGDREAIVRRADLGQKGVYYRAMVGPFGSAGDADQFCGGLKAAGGQCIVQKN